MKGSRFPKTIMGAFIGLTFTGGWLVADLLLPEPWGDYLLFGAMGVVNAAAGWMLGRMTDEKERAAEGPQIDAGGTIQTEPKV